MPKKSLRRKPRARPGRFPIAPDLQSQFIDLAARLSPENLTCDGECTRTQVRARLRAIYREWRALEAQAGRRVTEAEVDEWWFHRIDTGVPHAV